MTQEQREQIVDMLQTAYSMELESAENYLAASVNLEGIHALPVKRLLAEEVTDEFGHARRIAERIHVMGGVVPGSMQLSKSQRFLQPSAEGVTLEKTVAGVIKAEEAAITHYRLLAEMAEGVDFPTHDMAIELLADEESHRREFVGILRGILASSDLEDPEMKGMLDGASTTY